MLIEIIHAMWLKVTVLRFWYYSADLGNYVSKMYLYNDYLTSFITNPTIHKMNVIYSDNRVYKLMQWLEICQMLLVNH